MILKEPFVWKMGKTSLKDVWRYVKVESGGLFVIFGGAMKRQKSYVGNLDSQET